MRYLLFILCFLSSISSFCQYEELYKLTFSDTSNFNITTSLGHKRPAKIFVIDTTDNWNSRRFWLSELNKKSAAVIKQMEDDEHHSYNNTYLFTDATLDRLIRDEEKKSLSEKASKIKSKKIAFKGKNYYTVSSSNKIKGFYFVTTQPLLTSDKRYAFIDLVVFYKEQLKQKFNETYFGTVCVVYQKQPGNKWKKILVKGHLIL